MKKFLNVLGNIITVIILVFAIVLTTLVIASTKNEDGIPSLFGYSLFNVETDSMVGENGFDPGTLIIIKKLTPDEIDNLKVGDVVTYRRSFEGQLYLDTHRIAEITKEMVIANRDRCNIIEDQIENGVWVHGDTHYYVTKGDNEEAIDYQENGDIEFAYKGNIVGVWNNVKIPGLGSVLKFLKSQMGFMLCVVVPVLIFFVYELYVFIVTLSRKKKEEALAEVSNKEEELKAKAVAEFLAQQHSAAPAAESAKPVEPENTAESTAAPEVSEEEKAKIIAEYMAKQTEAMRNQEE